MTRFITDNQRLTQKSPEGHGSVLYRPKRDSRIHDAECVGERKFFIIRRTL